MRILIIDVARPLAQFDQFAASWPNKVADAKGNVTHVARPLTVLHGGRYDLIVLATKLSGSETDWFNASVRPLLAKGGALVTLAVAC